MTNEIDAKYREIPKEHFEISIIFHPQSEWDEVVTSALLKYTGIDISRIPEPFIFRFIILPDSEQERIERIHQIIDYGFDRTDNSQISKGHTVCDCAEEKYTFHGSKKFRLHELFDTLSPQPNALLIFKSDKLNYCTKCSKYNFIEQDSVFDALEMVIGII